MQEPSARVMKRGVPPTARNARTGEFTPPGITCIARANNSSLVAPKTPSASAPRGGASALGRPGAGLVDTARHSLGVGLRRRLRFAAAGGLAFFDRRQRPE